jgi:hypothetical protein
MKGSWVWYEANGLCEVQDIETMSEILNPHRLDDVKRRLLFEGETVEMAAERVDECMDRGTIPVQG